MSLPQLGMQTVTQNIKPENIYNNSE
jgi:hypothetical protein